MNIVPEIFSWILLLTGSLALIIGAIGMIRFPDFYTRLHAASVIDTLGCIMIITGVLFQAGFTMISVKLVLILIFILFTTPTATHALAKAALHGKLQPKLYKGEQT